MVSADTSSLEDEEFQGFDFVDILEAGKKKHRDRGMIFSFDRFCWWRRSRCRCSIYNLLTMTLTVKLIWRLTRTNLIKIVIFQFLIMIWHSITADIVPFWTGT